MKDLIIVQLQKGDSFRGPQNHLPVNHISTPSRFTEKTAE